jgi:CelD/BcsL family acetyltransferase involved in cellulose biosynthesis
MRVETVDGVPPELDAIACQSPLASFYHTRIWLECLTNSFPQWRFRCLVARSGEDVLGYLPYFVTGSGVLRRCLSLPFGTYGGPVVVEAGTVEEPLAARFARTRLGIGVQEVALVDFLNRARGSGMSGESVVTHVIDLEAGFDELWSKQFEKSKRRQTRKAEREGITVAKATSTEEVREYYRVYRERVDEWQQRLVYPESLFVELLQRGSGNVRLFLARAGDELLGGHLNFYFGDTVIAWNGVTTRDSHAVQTSTLLYSSCIRHACDNGYKRYNLGGSLNKETLIYYKQSLGGAPYEYPVLRWRSIPLRLAAAAKRSFKQ